MSSSPKNLESHLQAEKKRTLARCKQCGVCAKKCPIISRTNLNTISAKKIQEAIYRYLQDGAPNETVYTRVYSCMECFKCVDQCCPEGLDPFLINEIIKWEYTRRGFTDHPPIDIAHYGDEHRILAQIQVLPDEWRRISTPTAPQTAKYVFFPGCNVYFQPDKILSALDILDLLNIDYAFVPGLDHCCGDAFLYDGAVDHAETVFDRLIDQLAAYRPETVILWCPTCMCRFNKTFGGVKTWPFELMTLPQFLNQKKEHLNFKSPLPRKITLHEACKVAFTELDAVGPRPVLQAIPGVELVEMPRHGKHTACCGSGAAIYFPDSLAAIRDQRLKEAAETQADLLVDVCHYCHHQFVAREPVYPYVVANYISLIARSLGLGREDIYRKYRILGDVEGILSEAADAVATMPYPRDQIEAVIRKYF